MTPRSCLPSVDPFMQAPPAVHIVRIAPDPADQEDTPQQTLTAFSKRINRAAFTDHNAVLVTAGEDGYVRRWDVEVGRSRSRDVQVADLT